MTRKNKSNENPVNEPKPADHDITELMHAYELLQESQERYRLFIDAMGEGFAVQDGTNCLSYVNSKFCRMLGYSREELLGKETSRVIDASSLEVFRQQMRRRKGGQSQSYELTLIGKDGSKIPTIVSPQPLFYSDRQHAGSFAVFTDITKLKKVEEELRVSEQRYELAQKASGMGNWEFNIQTGDVHWSDQFFAIFGRPQGQVEPTYERWLECVHPQDRERVADQIASCIEGVADEYNMEYRIIRLDGAIRWIYTQARLFRRTDGKPFRILGMSYDITDRKNIEEDLGVAKQQAEAANLAKSQFLANMSHEIRTPMSVIMGFVDLMAMKELTDDDKSTIDIVQKAGKSLVRIIDDILDVSRIEVGALELHVTEFRLKELLDGVESMMQPLAEEKGLKFAVISSDGLPIVIHTDYGRVQQCLLNLINNAIKFTEKGHVGVKVSLEDKDKEPFLRIDVEDTGIGIPPDKLDSVFESFTRSDARRNHIHSGTGLGLTITRQLARLLGGDVTVTSEIDKGSVLSLVIPAGTAVLNEDDNEPVYESQTKETPQFSGKVLIVDDHEGIRKLFRSLLERLGLGVTLAEDGEEAIEIVLQQSFDLIFMDVLMPKLDGFEATRRLREKGITIPIVALTAYAMESDKKECLEAGSDDYLSKPINQEELKRILSKYIPAGGN